MRDCQERIDVDVYPPPDLAIESDVTSKTFLSAYEVIAVPEIWIYHNSTLKIFLLRNGQYVDSESSLLFPDLPVKILVPQLVGRAITVGTSTMLKEFRQSLVNTLKRS